MKCIYATFNPPQKAETALASLIDSGTSSRGISLVFPSNYQAQTHALSSSQKATPQSASSQIVDDAYIVTIAALPSIRVSGLGIVTGQGNLAMQLKEIRDHQLPIELSEFIDIALENDEAILAIEIPEGGITEETIRALLGAHGARIERGAL